jgi:P4 family phage/plasmid primase-like protien
MLAMTDRDDRPTDDGRAALQAKIDALDAERANLGAQTAPSMMAEQIEPAKSESVAPVECMFTDAGAADTIARAVLAGAYVWCKGLGWLHWSGRVWKPTTDEHVCEAIRLYALARYGEAEKRRHRTESAGWQSMLSATRLRNVLGLTRGIVEHRADEFDAHPDLLNTPDGVVDLRTAEVRSHNPELLLTKMTRGSYRTGYTHPDWEQALSALRPATRDWMQVRLGQGITGHPTSDGVIPICQGAGENGKSSVLIDGIVPACGDYAAPASPKLVADRGEHSTERADLRGQRLLIAEELTEDRALNVTAIKQIADVSMIKARYVHRDNMTFAASHSLFVTSNYVPVVNETDHGTWRRLALVVFPFTFRKPGEPLTGPNDRQGDPKLKARLRHGRAQQDAIVTSLVEGARRWYEHGFSTLPAEVEADTRAWRREADRILAFWDECLVPDPEFCVVTTELFAAFNAWMKSNGHHEWSKELFATRFGAHHETARHRIVEQRPRSLHNLLISTPPGTTATHPARPYLYRGLRFRYPDEVYEETGDAGVRSERSDPSEKPPTRGGSQEFADRSDQSDHDLGNSRRWPVLTGPRT